jgi:hypothetical protein
MRLWHHKPAAKPKPEIPRFHVVPPIDPRPEPMGVEENFDPTESMILRVKNSILKRLRGE